MYAALVTHQYVTQMGWKKLYLRESQVRKGEQHTTYKKRPEKCVFSLDLKVIRDLAVLTSCGRLFHTASDALVKVRCPEVDLSPVGMVRRRCVTDRRPLTPGLYSDTRSAR